MASGNGYDKAVTPSVQAFTKEQRQRLEALTFARKLVGHTHDPKTQPVNDWVYLARYIEKGAG